MTNTTKVKRTYLYARVSSGHQSTGLESQVRAMREYCERQGIVDFVIFSDENQSGAKSSRPALDSMMNSIREGECAKVIVYSFSRYARSVGHLLKALEEFRKLDVDFVSVTEQIDTNSTMGRAFFGLIAVMAQLERELIIERVRNGLANAKAKGVRLGREKKRDSHLIRSLRLSGLTYRDVGRIAKCSSGCVAAEIRLMKKEGLLDEKGIPVIQRLGSEAVKSKATPKSEAPPSESSNPPEDKLELVRF
jgi:DNA invertase Pin-like site-specific DNA recombinase